jgi:hypothetical protein
MSRKERGFKMGIGKAGSMLTPALFVLNLPVALARAPGEIAYRSGGRVEDFACMDVGQCNNGRVGVCFAEEAQISINGASNAKDCISCQVLLDARRILSKMLSMQESLMGPVLLTGWLTL